MELIEDPFFSTKETCVSIKKEVTEESLPEKYQLGGVVEDYADVDGGDEILSSTTEEDNHTKNSIYSKRVLAVLFGEGSKKLNHYCLYICDSSFFSAIINCGKTCLYVHEHGVATPYIYISNIYNQFAWHLENHANSAAHTSGRQLHPSQKVWFLVSQAFSYAVHALKEQLHFHLYEIDCMNILEGDPADSIFLSHADKTKLEMIHEEPQHLLIFDEFSQLVGINTIEAHKYVKEIRLCCGEDKEGYISQNLMYNLCGKKYHATQQPFAERANQNFPPAICKQERPCLDVVQSQPSSPDHNMMFSDFKIQIDEFNFNNLKYDNNQEDLQHQEDSDIGVKPDVKSKYLHNEMSSKSSLSSRSNVCVLITPPRQLVRGGPYPLVQCPNCIVSFRGTKDRLKRLFRHVRTSHTEIEDLLVRELTRRYRPLLQFMDRNKLM